MQFTETANFWLPTSVTLFIYHLAINPTNSGDFRFKLPGDEQSGAPLREYFH